MPAFTKETPRREITLFEETFTFPIPYTKGHICSEEEAQALNQLLGENLRQNKRRRVKKLKDENALNKEAFQQEIDEYIYEYEFSTNIGNAVKKDPLKEMAYTIALNLLKKTIKESGGRLQDVDINKLKDRARHEAETNGKLIHAAKTQLEMQQSLTSI